MTRKVKGKHELAYIPHLCLQCQKTPKIRMNRKRTEFCRECYKKYGLEAEVLEGE